jgi:hypothetical protein
MYSSAIEVYDKVLEYEAALAFAERVDLRVLLADCLLAKGRARGSERREDGTRILGVSRKGLNDRLRRLGLE